MRYDEHRTWGVELETEYGTTRGETYTMETLAKRLHTDTGLQFVWDYQNGRGAPRAWAVAYDGSINDGPGRAHGGLEVISPPLSGKDGLRQLRLVCDRMADLRLRVNARCGLHVHHHIADYSVTDMAHLVWAWVQHQDAMFETVAPGRRAPTNRHAQPLNPSLVERVIAEVPLERREISDFINGVMGAAGRYTALNLHAYFNHKTAEFRLHHGTISAEAVANWVWFTQGFISAARLDTSPLPGQGAGDDQFSRMLAYVGGDDRDEDMEVALAGITSQRARFQASRVKAGSASTGGGEVVADDPRPEFVPIAANYDELVHRNVVADADYVMPPLPHPAPAQQLLREMAERRERRNR